jgi:hypothetical protein
MSASRTPEGPLNYCPICGKHCRVEPSPQARDTVCPRCGSLLWSDLSVGDSRPAQAGTRLGGAERYWEPWTPQQVGFREAAFVTGADIRAWEATFGVELPSTLAQVLIVQNGGRLLGTEIDIVPLQRFGTFDQGEWAGLLHEEIPSQADRARLVTVGYLPGGRAVLDYRRPGEPRVRNMDPIFGGELRGEYCNFDELLRRSRERWA